MNKFIGVLGSLLFVVACASGIRKEDADFSLADIKNAIKNISGNIRSVSENQRTLVSQYFSPDGEKDFNPQKSPVRAYAIFTILGSRRPYDIEVQVMIENKKGLTYVEQGEDKELSQMVLDDLIARLNQSHENRNIIDHYRAF